VGMRGRVSGNTRQREGGKRGEEKEEGRSGNELLWPVGARGGRDKTGRGSRWPGEGASATWSRGRWLRI
jgi:hypothetical protein